VRLPNTVERLLLRALRQAFAARRAARRLWKAAVTSSAQLASDARDAVRQLPAVTSHAARAVVQAAHATSTKTTQAMSQAIEQTVKAGNTVHSSAKVLAAHARVHMELVSTAAHRAAGQAWGISRTAADTMKGFSQAAAGHARAAAAAAADQASAVAHAVRKQATRASSKGSEKNVGSHPDKPPVAATATAPTAAGSAQAGASSSASGTAKQDKKSKSKASAKAAAVTTKPQTAKPAGTADTAGQQGAKADKGTAQGAATQGGKHSAKRSSLSHQPLKGTFQAVYTRLQRRKPTKAAAH
jgi:hypothetical protein